MIVLQVVTVSYINLYFVILLSSFYPIIYINI